MCYRSYSERKLARMRVTSERLSDHIRSFTNYHECHGENKAADSGGHDDATLGRDPRLQPLDPQTP